MPKTQEFWSASLDDFSAVTKLMDKLELCKQSVPEKTMISLAISICKRYCIPIAAGADVPLPACHEALMLHSCCSLHVICCVHL